MVGYDIIVYREFFFGVGYYQMEVSNKNLVLRKLGFDEEVENLKGCVFCYYLIFGRIVYVLEKVVFIFGNWSLGKK